MTEQQFRAMLASAGLHPNDETFADWWQVAIMVREQCTTSLRDQFAGQAMQALINRRELSLSLPGLAYSTADAMLEARDRK